VTSGVYAGAMSWAITLPLWWGSAAHAAEIYKWTGADGVTHYAAAPPEADLAGLEVLEVTAATPAVTPVANYQTVLDVAGSIEASRLARERARLEREKLRLQERRLAAQQAYREDRDTGDGVYYLPYYRYHRPYKPHGPHRTLKPYPYRYGQLPSPAPHSNGSQSPGARVYLSR